MASGSHRGQWLATAAIGVLALGTLTTGLAHTGGSSDPTIRTVNEVVTVPGGPTVPGTVRLATTLYLPVDTTSRHPAVIVSPGFGQTKASVATDARALAAHGYIALAWTMRGFDPGATDGGRIALDAPDTEVADLRHLIDHLAQRPDVVLDGPGDPRVGLVGGSYGGGVSLLGAALDDRVDAIVPVITWNSLESSLLPGDVFKAQYAAVFFSGATAGGCRQFAQRVCTTYQRIAQTGRATAADRALLRASSPGPLATRIKAPTLLIQGEDDTLFPLSESLATADALRTNGTPVHLAWVKGGHDAPFGSAGEARIRALTANWLDRWLGRDTAVSTGPVFRWDRSNGQPGTASSLPPLKASTTVALSGPQSATVSNPPGGRPASISSVPGAGALGGIAAGLGFDIPGQSASWQTPPLRETRELLGAGELKVHVSSTTGEAVLFAKVLDVAPDGSTKLPGGQVAPIRLTGVGGAGRDITLRLPTLAHVFPAGNRIRVAVATTDLGYAGPVSPASYQVSLLPATALTLPLVTLSGARGYGTLALVSGVLLAAALAVGAYIVLRRRRHPPDLGDDDVPPVVITGLAKSYADGFRAVDGVDLVVERGQVLGLLGPNGAGKTTTLRMLAGLIAPSAGEVRLFGRTVTSGAPVLSRVGLFIEGPGLLPHLTGMENLRLYWTSTAPSMEGSYVEEALDIAGLGSAVDRPVRTYSQGMRQRLAIAQAMLGRPDLLVLDEPTNGLDPPQIKEVREVLRAIAATGRTVLVSSHLLSEVEQTCSHVAVMSRGKMVAQGTVDELLADDGTVRVEVDDQARALAVLRRLAGVTDVVADDGALVVELGGTSRAAVVAALVEAGVAVLGVASRRRLEDVFLELLGAPA
ncbi:MAG: transporter ATP-binding protein [Frankiales bacterium]|nr:transporter ATP-binding protein [Frankiales bacterium]